MEIGRTAFKEKVEKGQLHPSIVFHWIYLNPDRNFHDPKLKWLNEGPLSKSGFSQDARFRDFAGYRLESDNDHAVLHDLARKKFTEFTRIDSKNLSAKIISELQTLMFDFYLQTKKYSFQYRCQRSNVESPVEIDVDFIGRYFKELGFVATTNSHVIVTLKNNDKKLIIGDEASGETSKETGGIISGRFHSRGNDTENTMTLSRDLISPEEVSMAESFLGKDFASLKLPLYLNSSGKISYQDDQKAELTCTWVTHEKNLNDWLMEQQ